METRKTLAAFFGRHGFDMDGIGIDAVIDGLLFDMESALAGKKDADMPMLSTWTVPPKNAPRNCATIVIDAGGTNFRVCLVTFDAEGRAAISRVSKSAMPGTDREYGRADFFAACADRLESVRDLSDRIGFVFSYPMKSDITGDGEVIAWAKEVRAPEVLGARLGAELKEALAARRWKTVNTVALLNDTTAALLAGTTAWSPGKKYSAYAGIILGTGLNAAYFDDGSGKPEDERIIVTEACLFNKLPRSDFDAEIDAVTSFPGTRRIEKMAAGAYLGAVITAAVHHAADEGLFSAPAAKLINNSTLSLKDVDDFLYGPRRLDTVLGTALESGTSSDAALVYGILDAFVDRSARLTSALISAAVLKTGKGTDPTEGVCVVAEGTTFVRSWKLRERVNAYLEEHLRRRRNRYAEVITLENAVTLGAAVAGVSIAAGRGR